MFRQRIIVLLTITSICSGYSQIKKDLEDPISSNPTPSISLNSYDTTICPGGTTPIQAQISGVGPFTIKYKYLKNGKIDSNIVNYLTNPGFLQIDLPGNYTITSYANDAISVDTNIAFTVAQIAPPTAVLEGGGTFCSNETLEPISVQLGGSPPWSLIYQVNFGNAQTINLNQASSLLLDSTGVITIRKISDTFCTAEVFDTAEIKLSTAPVAKIIGDSVFCAGDTAVFYSAFKSKYKYRWFVPNGANNISGITSEVNRLALGWPNAGDFKIELIVETIGSGCSSGSIFLPIKVHALPQPIEAYDTVICFDREGSFDFYPASKAENKVFWPHLNDNADFITIDRQSEFEFWEISPEQCNSLGSFRVIDKCIAEIYVADAFTPNGDNINDLLTIQGVYQDLTLQIYTLSGELVYTMESRDLPWDGTSQGKAMPNGTYFWEAEFHNKFDEKFTDKGWVRIIR